MRQILFIPLICYLAFLAEFACFNLFGRWGDPQWLLLVLIFFNLYSGIRFSLWAALCAGVLMDCFSTMPFGTHIFAYVVCACVSLGVRKYCYERGSDISRVWMVCCVVSAHTLVMGLTQKMVYEEVQWIDVLRAIWLPEIIVTAAVSILFFNRLRDMARLLKF